MSDVPDTHLVSPSSPRKAEETGYDYRSLALIQPVVEDPTLSLLDDAMDKGNRALERSGQSPVVREIIFGK
jgi:hypothetical protein